MGLHLQLLPGGSRPRGVVGRAEEDEVRPLDLRQPACLCSGVISSARGPASHWKAPGAQALFPMMLCHWLAQQMIT